MTIKQKHLEALKTFDDYVPVSEWAERFGQMFPDELEKANRQAENQANDTTGLREIAARISSRLTTGAYKEHVIINDSERPRKAKYITTDELKQQTQNELDEDIEPLRRQDIINNAKDQMELVELYRIAELENIQRAFKQFFGIDFEIDHAQALFDSNEQGNHHPDNLQFLLKLHNGKKNKSSWKRFTFEEQADYIKKAMILQSTVADKLNLEIDNIILDALLQRLKSVY